MNMKRRIDGPIDPFLLVGAAGVLLASGFALHELGMAGWDSLWRYWMLLLVIVS